MSKLQELEEELKRKKGEYIELTEHLKNKEKEILEILYKKFEADPDYIKVECGNCDGEGHYRAKDKTLRVCENCDKKGWIWVKRWKE